DGGAEAGIAAFAKPAQAERVRRGGDLFIEAVDRGHVPGGGRRVVPQRAGDDLPRGVVLDRLLERVSDAPGDAPPHPRRAQGGGSGRARRPPRPPPRGGERGRSRRRPPHPPRAAPPGWLFWTP